MPATSKTQFRLFSQVYGVQKFKETGGKEGLNPNDLNPDYRKQIEDMADEMKKKDVKDMIDVDYEKLPDEVKESAELEVGTKVEFEHTKDPKEAEKIAKDHLSEDPNYYSKLYKAGLIDEQDTIELAKKAFENNAMATPGSVNGMGDVALPGAPGTDETGSGDIAATSALTDDDDDNDDDGKKIYKFLKFNAFVGESLNESISVKPGEYIKTEHGYYYKRVDGKVGGQDAFVAIDKGKETKRKTGIHNSVSFEIVDKDEALK